MIIDKHREDYEDDDQFENGYDSVTEVDEYSDDASEYAPYSTAGVNENDENVSVKDLEKSSDQLFFEFFSMYTKESVKAQRGKTKSNQKIQGIKLS